MRKAVEHFLAGLDLNASRVRAVAGAAGEPRAQQLDGHHADLPVALSLAGRVPEVGRAGLALCRCSPHLACVNFLPHLDGPRTWHGGHHRLDAAAALGLVLRQLQTGYGKARGLALAIPAYLSLPQIATLTDLVDHAGLPLLGSVPAPLAAGLAAHADQAWSGLAYVVDADDHALTWTALLAGEGHARVLAVYPAAHLRLSAWKDRLLDAVADRCVRQSRRDPRDSAVAEQSLWEQLETVLDVVRSGRLAELAVETPHWYQNLILRPEELSGFCTPLVRQALKGARALRTALSSEGSPDVVLVTAAAGRLPGLVVALEQCVENPGGRDQDPPDERRGGQTRIQVLPADAAARAVHDLAARFDRGELPHGHLDAAPLPPPQPVEAGPPRLQFRGQDFVLCGLSFTLGRHSGCDLVFDEQAHPSVAPRHCEIVFERRQYVLRNRTPQGTLVNKRPVLHQVVLRAGDWVRLGADGPLLRFLGQPTDQKRVMTIA
jgi:hypothetical protein